MRASLPSRTVAPASQRVPPAIGAAAEAVVAAHGQHERLARVFDHSPVPLAMIGEEGRFAQVNRPARLVLRMTSAKLRTLRIEDLTPPSLWPVMEAGWAQLVGTGCTAGPYEVTLPDGGRFDIVCCSLANALPGLHVVAFAPTGWAEDELAPAGAHELEPRTALTPRELDVLQLAAEGCTGPLIARELMVSPVTVKTHFENIYAKTGVAHRAAAVAHAMRLGLID
jgi:DNA-binding CsgD family transcriptional regulator